MKTATEKSNKQQEDPPGRTASLKMDKRSSEMYQSPASLSTQHNSQTQPTTNAPKKQRSKRLLTCWISVLYLAVLSVDILTIFFFDQLLARDQVYRRLLSIVHLVLTLHRCQVFLLQLKRSSDFVVLMKNLAVDHRIKRALRLSS